jgi:hypothetical protein
MDSNKNRIAVTDLGTNTFTVYRYSKHMHQRSLEPVVHAQRQGSGNGLFGYISGVRIDEYGEMWVCDAINQKLQWLDRNGTFKMRIEVDDSFAYASNFAVNTVDKELLVCDRKRSNARLYELGSMKTLAILEDGLGF